MLEIEFNIQKFEQSLREFDQRFSRRMEIAGRRIFASFLGLVVDFTPKPGGAGESQNIEYVRTGRLVGGWGPAANALGMAVPYGSAEGSFRAENVEGEITFRAENHCPYAIYVELIGPWIIPPNAPGGPRWRGGEHMVEKAKQAMISMGQINTILAEEWDRIG